MTAHMSGNGTSSQNFEKQADAAASTRRRSVDISMAASDAKQMYDAAHAALGELSYARISRHLLQEVIRYAHKCRR